MPGIHQATLHTINGILEFFFGVKSKALPYFQNGFIISIKNRLLSGPKRIIM